MHEYLMIGNIKYDKYLITHHSIITCHKYHKYSDKVKLVFHLEILKN